MRFFKAVFLFALLLLGSCGRAKESPKPEKILRMNITREPTSMDPRRGNDLTSSALHFTLFEGLTRIDPDGRMSLAQAKSVELSDDRKTYTFHLRGTRWSDGSLVTAKDFEVSWKTSIAPNFPAFNGQLFYIIKNAEAAKKGNVSLDKVGIKAIDDATFVVELENPTPYFLDLCAFANFMPINHKIEAEHPDWANEAGPLYTTNGPFTIASWKHSNEVVFQKNPYYWEADHILLDQIRCSMVSDENTVLNMFENGEIDLLGHGITNIPIDAIKKFEESPFLHVSPSPGSTFIAFNTTRPPFNNKNIRKAFALAIDRKEIVENISQLGEDPATTLIPPLLTGRKQAVFYTDSDIVQAKALFEKGLQEIGILHEQFPSVVYSYSNSSGNPKIAQALQNQWEKVFGIRVCLQNCEHKVLLDKLSAREYDMGQALYIAFYNDPIAILERFKYRLNLKNYPGWENPEYIRLLDKSAADDSPIERERTLKAAEALIMDEMPLTALYHWRAAYLIQPNVVCQNNLNYGAHPNFARLAFKEGP